MKIERYLVEVEVLESGSQDPPERYILTEAGSPVEFSTAYSAAKCVGELLGELPDDRDSAHRLVKDMMGDPVGRVAVVGARVLGLVELA